MRLRRWLRFFQLHNGEVVEPHDSKYRTGRNGTTPLQSEDDRFRHRQSCEVKTHRLPGTGGDRKARRLAKWLATRSVADNDQRWSTRNNILGTNAKTHLIALARFHDQSLR